MINNILTTLKLTDEEIKTYWLLVETGESTAGNLAKKIGIPRPSLYGFLKRIQDKGMITQSMKCGVKTFIAEPPEKIGLLLQQQIEQLQNQQKLYQQLLPELKKHRPSKFLTPKFQLFEGVEGVQNALKDMLLYRDIETYALWPIKTMIDILTPDFVRYLNKIRLINNLWTWAIWPSKQAVDIKQHPYLGIGKEFKREIRIAPKEIELSMGYWIYGNKVVFISSRKESVGFVIESAELVEMLLTQFQVIWKKSKPVVVDPKDTALFLEEVKKTMTIL